MRIAVLISGEPRSIVFKEQINSFKCLFDDLTKEGYILDTYCMFKLNPVKDFIQSEEGLINLEEILKLFRPKYLEFFYEFKEDVVFNKKFNKQWPPMFFSQIKMIDTLIIKSYEYEYDLFLRIRPDCVLNGKLDISKMKSDTVYTSVKCDAVGNDQMFICSRHMIDKWWIPIIRPANYYIFDLKVESSLSPDYFIFYHCPTAQIIKSGLIRDYEKIISWIGYPGNPLLLENFWNYKESYQKLNNTMDRPEFLEKLRNIVSKYGGVMNTDIPV